ncbi:glycosyltransferase family 4 protein [Nesterenkonia sp.]|uniref:glycosyltransferase family 4 protein n=1 Tax=Nesterenkonia sp. TaxID=704201 RepID=UPI002630BD9A|nr:glycosyltransferase family 4 protein [Nesterenkonia sp.]
MTGRPRIRFQIQPTVSHYREPLVRRLRQSRSLALEMVGRFSNSEAQQADRIQSASARTLQQVTALQTLTAGLLWWEKGQVSAVWRGGFDAYVLEGRIYTVSTWAAAVAGRLRRRRVLLWGHGWKRPEGGAKRQLRLCFYRLVDGLMVYGDRAKELGISYGVPESKIQVVYNSLYSEADLPDAARARAQVASAAAGRPTLIYCSRLTTRHRLDILAEALRDWPEDQPAPRVLIVGDGVERPRLQRLFAEAGVEAEFLGAVYEFRRLAELYSQADVALSVGGAGLNVIQALGFAVPVVAESGHRDSSPEIEAVVEGVSGRYFHGGSAESLREVLHTLLQDRELLARLGERGQQIVRRRYTAERHAEAIEAALHHFLSR